MLFLNNMRVDVRVRVPVCVYSLSLLCLLLLLLLLLLLAVSSSDRVVLIDDEPEFGNGSNNITKITYV